MEIYMAHMQILFMFNLYRISEYIFNANKVYITNENERKSIDRKKRMNLKDHIHNNENQFQLWARLKRFSKLIISDSI